MEAIVTTELDALDPRVEQVKLSTGTFVELEQLRTRQFFKLLRILTHGAGSILGDLFRVDPNENVEEFATRLITMLAFSIPDAENETIAFLRSMCKPVGLIERRELNKQDRERNAELWRVLDAELDNPELDDLLSLVEAIVRRESADIQALGKRLAAMLKLAQKTGQLSPGQTSPTPNSSADSPEPSTSSPPSTDGPTTSSVDSVSPDSGSASPPSTSDATTSPGSDGSG